MMPGVITIVGLGPGVPSLRTVGAINALASATKIILRTRIHPGIDDLREDPRASSCDDLYEHLPNFELVYDEIATRVLEAASDGDIVFVVPGHPLFAERSVQTIVSRATALGIEVKILDAVSALDAIASTLQIDPFASELQLIDAESLDGIWESEPYAGGRLAIDPTRPCLVTQVYSNRIASHAKLALGRVYLEDHEVVMIAAAGVPGAETMVRCRLFEIDHQEVNHLTSLYIPPLPDLESYKTADSVLRIVAQLRAPGGCPWDRKQDHATLRNAVLEEAYEVVDAIDERDPDHLAEELGDLFLLIAMHSQIAHETGDFAIEDVFEKVSRKLIRRHPHVFGDVVAETPDEVVTTWEGVKRQERVKSVDEQNRDEAQPFDRLPRSMPVLTRVADVLGKQSTLGYTARGNRDALAGELYDAVQAIVASGFDPERELERIARVRLGLSEVIETPTGPNKQ
jgi:tetrapyrrole methylase family protein / MazG family protein